MSGPILALIAVRLKSARCPEKGLANLAGKPLILRLQERLVLAQTPDHIVWCTSTNPQDDALEQLAHDNGVEVFRGDELDVLSRFVEVSKKYNANHVIRITGDNPLTDPIMLDFMVNEHIAQDAEYTYVLETDMPRGTRVEVISAPALLRCHELAQDPAYSEYMTLMFRRPEYFRVLQLHPYNELIRRGDIRLTVDTPEDLQVVRAVYDAFEGKPPMLEDVIAWVDDNPEIKALNQSIQPSEITSNINVHLKGD